VTIPQVKSKIIAFQQKEFSLVKNVLQNEFNTLATYNYDYAVWEDTYQFIQDLNEEYIEDNYVPDTFKSLEIEGAFYLDMQGEVLWSEFYNWRQKDSLPVTIDSSHFAFIAEKIRAKQNSAVTDDFAYYEVPKMAGLLEGSNGVNMYAATLIKRSDRSGDSFGLLVFVRQFNNSTLDKVANISGVEITYEAKNESKQQCKSEAGGVTISNAAPKREMYFNDVVGHCILAITVTHALHDDLTLFDDATLLIFLVLILVPVSLQLLVHFSLLRPLTDSISRVGVMLEKEQLSSLKSSPMISEIRWLNQDFNLLIERISLQKEQMEQLSLLDGLTSIANRRSFEFSFEHLWQATLRTNQPLAIVMCDIDHFKKFNDNYGHQAGDKAIVEVAQALSKRIARPHDVVCRYGGEEFVVILPDCNVSQCEQVLLAIQDMIKALEITHEYSPTINKLTVSMGVCVIENIEQSLRSIDKELVLKVADDALYQAKQQGRNRFVITTFDKNKL
jgi:diguanylate cyclase (GGDEF)-like protein